MHARRVTSLATILAMGLGLAACTGLNSGSEFGVARTGDRMAAPVESNGALDADLALGQQEHPKILAAYGGQYASRKAEVMIARIAGRVLSAAGQPNQKLTVSILDSAEVNAFALPGGYVYVTRGLLALANSTAELAAVVSHEIAHVTLRHAQARSDRVRSGQIVDRVLGTILGADPNTDVAAARSRRSLAAFSQNQELEADREGIRYAGQAGYDPHAAARFLAIMGRFARFAEGEGQQGGDFLSSHPSTPQRIEEAVKSARGFGAPGIGEDDRDAFLDAVDGLLFGDNPDRGVISGERFVHPRLEFTFAVPDQYQLSNDGQAVVAVARDGSALRFDAANVPDGMPLGDYLQSGWVEGLDAASLITGSVNGNEMAEVGARSDKWFFRIAAVRYGGQVYRFIFAAEQDTARFTADFRSTVESFRRTRDADMARVRNYKVSVVEARPGQNAQALAAMMEGVRQPEGLFLVLNGMLPGDPVVAGQSYKIVTYK